MRETDARLSRALASLALSYFSRYRANAVSFRNPARDCFIPRFYSSTFIIFFISGSFLEISKSSAPNARVHSPPYLRRFALSRQGKRGTMLERVLHAANREAEKGHLRAAKLDHKGRHKLLGRYSPTSFSLSCLSRCVASRPPKYAPAENSRDTPVMKLSRTLLPLRLSSPFITRDYDAPLKASLCAPLKIYFQLHVDFSKRTPEGPTFTCINKSDIKRDRCNFQTFLFSHLKSEFKKIK